MSVTSTSPPASSAVEPRHAPSTDVRRVRLAFVTAYPIDPDKPHGGVEAVSVVLVRALSRFADLDLHVVTTHPDCHAPQSTSADGVTLHRLPRSGRWTLTDAIWSGRRAVSDYVRRLQPDVIHAHDVFGLMVKGLPIPRVFTVHGFINGDTRISGARSAWMRSLLWRRIEEGGWADQPHIISISPYVRERLSGIATGVIHDIDNPISPEFFDVPRPAGLEPVIFSAAVISPRKNPIALVDALDELVRQGIPARLRLAGPVTDEPYARRLRERIDQLKLSDRVSLLGSISGPRVREELANASIFALVSLEEGSPMGVEEAMAAGVPVVTSNRCGMPYMVRDGESGFLVNPLDARDVAWRLGKILSDRELAARMSDASRRIALDRFHPDSVARRTREVYLRALRDRVAPGNGHVRA